MLVVKKTETVLVPQTTTTEAEIYTREDLETWVRSLGVDAFNANYITRILIGYNPEVTSIGSVMALDRLHAFIRAAEKVIESEELSSPED